MLQLVIPEVLLGCGLKLARRTLVTSVVIDKWYPSSKTCHECGHVYRELQLGDRMWICPHCGVLIMRDYNAALNIRDEGLRLLWVQTLARLLGAQILAA